MGISVDIAKAKVAWLVPSASSGAYYGAIIAEISFRFRECIFFTGAVWPGFECSHIGNAKLKVVGRTKVVKLQENDGYGKNLILASPGIIFELFKCQPHIIIGNGFSIWTLFALLMKGMFKWKVIVILDGISPSTTFQNSGFRLLVRQLMIYGIDAFVANSKAAERYLNQTLGVCESRVYCKTYIVPDPKALDTSEVENDVDLKGIKILYIGSLISRKGVRKLLEAASILKDQGFSDFTLILIGDGDERSDLESFVKSSGLKSHTIFTGWLNHSEIGNYLKVSDIFVLPSFEDTWGAVLLEAMAFGKPVVCSKMAGSSEVVVEGINGFIFDPYDSSQLADKLSSFFENPDSISTMGEQSKAIISSYSTKDVAHFFSELSQSLLSSSK